MRVDPQQLGERLAAGLAPVYLIHGDEPLLVEEAVEAVRVAAAAAGYDERSRHAVETGFDWGAFRAEAASGSLFASRRLVELRLPGGRPGEAGGKALVEWAGDPPPDTLLLVICARLDGAARKSRWFQALDGAGVQVPCRGLDAARLPAWLRARMTRRGLAPTPEAVEALAYYTAGNLLAAAQEIDKLALLCPDGRVDLPALQASLADSARFDVYNLADRCLAGEAAGALRVLHRLKAGGTAPALVLWALANEVHRLQRIGAALDGGAPRPRVFQAERVWSQRQGLVEAALGRLGAGRRLGLVRRLAWLDRLLKGRADGDVWLELERLCLALCGHRPVPLSPATGIIP